MLEPRRVAARAIAARMASLLGESVGETIGYRVRRDSRISSHTRLEVVTEGVLTRMLIADPTLDGYSLILFDEVHERSLHTDLALALTRVTQSLIRDDLRILLMSATIDTSALCQALSAPLVEAQGRMYPVDIRHLDGDIVHAIYTAMRETEGDILCFLPGEAEILRTKEALTNISAFVRPLYGRLSPEEQDLAIAPSRSGERKIILATNIAETSLTIDGVRVVIDSGLHRVAVFDPRTGMSHLENRTISLDMATQRSGRAGRTAPGICYRLWPLAAEHKMRETRMPEIFEADLSSLVLDVAAWGGKVTDLPWLTAPNPARVAQSLELLRLLGAVDSQGVITPLGKRMNALPYHPRLAKMMTVATNRALATRIAEVLEEGRGTIPHTFEAGKLIASAYPERIAMKIHDTQYRLASGIDVRLEAGSELCAHLWLAVADVNPATGHVFTAAPLHVEEVDSLYTRRSLSYDLEREMVLAYEECRVGQLVVSRKPIHNVPESEKLTCVLQAVRKSGLSIFSWTDDEVVRLQRRVAALRQWHPELDLPDLSAEAVMAHPEDWIPTSDLRQFDLHAALLSLLSYEQQILLDRLAPSHVLMPSGHRIRLDYRPAAQAPVLSVRLQECFGMLDTPRVDDNKRAVLMELLSPGFKPVQLTSDLRSFWQTTYFDVKKELKRRYPKHAWPDNPI